MTAVDEESLSESWALAQIRDLVEIHYGKGLREDNRKTGPVPVYGSNGIVGTHNVSLTNGPTIILGRKGSIGAIHFCSSGCWPIDTTYYVDNFRDLDPTFLVAALRNLNLAELDTSTAIPGLNRDDIYDQEIVLPPLAEQKRLAVQLGHCADLVKSTRDHLSRVPTLLKRLRQAVLAAACSGRLTEDWQSSRRSDGDNSSENEIGWDGECLPPNWKMVSVAEVATVLGGKRLPKGSRYASSRTPHPYIRVTDLRDMSVSTDDLKYIDQVIQRKIKRYTISDSDVYISIAGSIGKVGLVPGELNGANLTENAAKLTAFSQITKEYMVYAFNSEGAQARIKESITSSGQPKLALFRIEKMRFPLPPVLEQQEIAKRVKALFETATLIEERVSAARIRTKQLTQSILARAFRGELVPTEAELARREGREYEPASVLLERIKARREAEKKTTPKRRTRTSKARVTTA